MLKYIKQHMASIAGIEIYPVISFVIFFLFFLVVALWVVKGNKDYFSKMSALPLEEENK
ncbi:MAG TPA: hypothetical protein VNB90_11975 [Cytophagaceae bacterium]|nr:hypothetical protein [Cytophagaceae bacterium]